MENVMTQNVFGFDRYPIEIREQNGIFHLLCKTLGVVESDASLDKAYEKLNQQRSQIISKLTVFGVNPDRYYVNIGGNRSSGSTFPKFAKYLVVFLLLLIPFGLVSGYVL